MNTVATATTHPALVLRNAVDTITTELVRADIAPGYLTVGTYTHGTQVTMLFKSREAFDAALSLFGLSDVNEYDSDDSRRVSARGKFMGLRVSVTAPAFPEVVADCDSA